jgi:hypothetical protein
MKPKTEDKQQLLVEEYKELMEENQFQISIPHYNPQWNNPSDFITKFSLYSEVPKGIASSNTLVISKL